MTGIVKRSTLIASVGMMLLVHCAGAQETRNLSEIIENRRKAALEAQEAIDRAKGGKEAKEAEEEKDPFEDLPKSGVLSSYGAGVGSQEVGGFGKIGLDEETGPPVTGAVQRQGDRWEVTVSNASEKHVQASLRLIQRDKDGKQVRNDFITASLKPQSQYKRTVPAGLGSSQVSLELTNWTAS